MKNAVVKSTKLKDLKNKLVVVKVGDKHRPAGVIDIKSIRKLFKKALKGVKCRLVVCHHAVSVKIV